MKITKSILFVFLVALLFGISIMHIACSNSSKRSTAEIAAIKAAMDSVEDQTGKRGTERQWKAGPLNGGIGVLSYHGGAYWYKDGIIYAANGLAMGLSPKIEVIQRVKNAPTGIGYSEIEAVAK